MSHRTYLDYAASTPTDKTVLQAMHAVENNFANPSAQYASARQAAKLITASRKQIAGFFGANSEEIIFTSGATESNNLAILGAARAINKKGQIISIATEHASVREPLNQLTKEGYEVVWCKIDGHGRISLAEFDKLLNYDTVLVTINYASSEIGTVQQIAKLSQIIKRHEQSNGTKVVFHTDASAAVQVLNCDVARLGVDLMTIGGSKIYGPKAIGLLYIKRGTKINPIIFGGKQESSVRSGSQNTNQIVGLAKSLQVLLGRRKQDLENYREQYTNLMHNLSFDIDIIENGHPKDSIFSICSFCIKDAKGEDLVAYLDAAGFEVATGAACEASSNQPSPALLAIGRSEQEANGSLRVSFGRVTTHKDIDNFCKSLKNTLNALK